MNDFENKVVIVTGAGSGIGRATAKMFAAGGAQVVCADINDDTARRTASEIKEANGAAAAVRCDIGRESDARNLTAQTLERFGRVDVLVNNAARFLRRGADAATAEDWDAVMRTNVAGTALCSRFAAAAMKETGGGSIIVVSSMNGKRADKGYATYCASKAALLMLVRCMALDFAPWKIRVNAVLPGAVETPALIAALDEADLTVEEFLPMAEGQQCLQGLVQPEDVAHSILFLASDAARMMTGAEILVDAGWQASK